MTSPISFITGISVGSKKPMAMLIMKNRTINRDGKSTFDTISSLNFFRTLDISLTRYLF